MTAVKLETNLSDTNVSYFRHKGIKVKFKDIEDVIVEHPCINKVAILFGEDNEGNRRLVAYIIPHEKFNQKDIMNFLAGKLESFMIPAVWICVKKFPLTHLGSIDKIALPELQPVELPAGVFAAPCTNKEIQLSVIIKKILKLESISIHDNFLRLGGNSLKALTIIASIRKALNVPVDLKHFFLYPSIAELAAYLDGENTIKNTSHSKGIKYKPNPGSVFHNTSIVPVKTSGAKMPLYIVCGGGGTVFKFEKFAHMLGEDHPVYGLQQPSDINELEHFPDTIEDIAAKYVNEIQLIDPDGPYALSGHCIGGAIALEMARKLQSLGKKIHLLAMFDVILTKDQESQKPSINNVFNFKAIIKKAGKKIWNKLEFETFLLTRYPLRMLNYRQRKLAEVLNKVVPYKKEDADIKVFKKFEKKFLDAYAKYKVKPFSGEMIVFYAKDRYGFFDKEKSIIYKKHELPEEVKNLWKEHVNYVQIFEVDGEHNTMFEPGNSKNFAGILQQHLQMRTS